MCKSSQKEVWSPVSNGDCYSIIKAKFFAVLGVEAPLSLDV